MTIREYVPLSQLTTLRVGGNARYVIDITSQTMLKEALNFAMRAHLPVIVLGDGSNVLASDGGYAGVVLRMLIPGIVWNDKEDHIILEAGAGVKWDELVAQSVKHGYWGIENLSGIPGTTGAAPIQNIGAYGVELKDVLVSVDVFDRKHGAARRIDKEECNFGYRDSIFKHKDYDQLIVIGISIRLEKIPLQKIHYKDVAEYFGEIKPDSSSKIRDAILEIRSKKFPDLNKFGTAGSFFKNPIVPDQVARQFLAKYPTAPSFPMGNGTTKLSAPWIIDHVIGWRGHRSGAVGLWNAHALVLVNYENATAKEIKIFSDEIRYRVAVATNILLEPEVIFLRDE